MIEHQVVVAVVVAKGKVLLEKKQGGNWALPGGHVKKNETPQTALIRELKEELSLDIDLAESNKIGGAIIRKVPGDKHFSEEHIHEHINFQVNIAEAQKIYNAEGQTIKWFSKIELTELSNINPGALKLAMFVLQT